ncbi:MAG: hypothetical protein HYU74_04670 [Dechloromonas sp.]|nr:hypothetical protein [Dechloromonas sp.]
MFGFNQSTLLSLEATATTSAAYLDACDSGNHPGRDPNYYRECGDLLTRIFLLVDAEKAFPNLLARSAAAREIADSIQIRKRIEAGRQAAYPELAILLNRVSQ